MLKKSNFYFQIQKIKTMSVTEQPCYTLINTSQDLESTSEMQLREELEKGNDKVCQVIFFYYFQLFRNYFF